MRTPKGDRPMNHDDSTQPDPDSIVSADTETLGSLATAGASTPSKHNTAPGFDPWRFGTHDVSAELRQEILEKGFPDTPDDQLFTKRHKTDAEPAAEKAPDAAGGEASRSEPNAARRADTLRLHHKPPLVSPLRAAAPWLVLSAVAAFLFLWLLLGRDKPKPEQRDVQDMPSAVGVKEPKLIVRDSPQPPPPTLATPSSLRSSGPEAAPSASGSSTKRSESKSTKPTAPGTPRPAAPPHTAPPTIRQPPTPPTPVPTPGSGRVVPADD